VALVADEQVSGGLLLRQMPSQPIDEYDWNRPRFLAQTLTTQNFDAGLDLIAKIFAEDDVRVHEPRPVNFRCRCSDQKIEDALKTLGEDESRAALAEQSAIEVVCEYCGQNRSFDSVDVTRLLSANVVAGPESVQ